MLRKLQNKQGFTLIELLIVIVILGILIVIVIGATSGNKSKANDDKRNADITRIQTALEDCYTDAETGATTKNANTYPANLSDTCVTGKFTDQQGNHNLPVDPKSNNAYSYTTDGSTYTLKAYKDDGTTVLTTLSQKQ